MLQIAHNLGIQRIGYSCEQNWCILHILYKRLGGRRCNPQNKIIFVSGNLLGN
ncbi:hypothetical protein D3C71_2085260 [compost metagenome]